MSNEYVCITQISSASYSKFFIKFKGKQTFSQSVWMST